MTRARTAGGLSLIAIAIIPAALSSQTGCSGSSSCTIDVTMTVTQPVMRLTVTNGGAIALGNPAETEYVQTFKDASLGAPVTVGVQSNQAFSLSVKGHTATFGYVGTLANPNKSASDLLWSTTSAGLATTTNNMGTASLLFPQAAGSVSQTMVFRTKWHFATDVPGNYSLIVDLTLSSP